MICLGKGFLWYLIAIKNKTRLKPSRVILLSSSTLIVKNVSHSQIFLVIDWLVNAFFPKKSNRESKEFPFFYFFIQTLCYTPDFKDLQFSIALMYMLFLILISNSFHLIFTNIINPPWFRFTRISSCRVKRVHVADERRQEYLDVYWCQSQVIRSKIFKIKYKVT